MAMNPAISRRIVDALVALVFLAVGWLSTGATTTSDPFYTYTARDWLFIVLLILITVPYAWRRRWPTAAFLISMLATTMLWLLGYNAGALPLLLIFGGYFVAVARPFSEVLVCSVVAVSCFAVLWWGGGAPYRAQEFFISVLAIGLTLGLGRAGRLRVDLANARAAAAEEAVARQSSEERLRIARELHDIIGHSLGTIAVQAGVGRHLMDTEPEKAADALDSIAKISRDSLDEVRSVVAALRDDEPPYRPSPSLTDLPDLIETVRITGLAVELKLPDDLEAIPRQAGAAVYRITREALTNVVRHARASTASVQVDHHDGLVEVAIRDDGGGVGNGREPHSGAGNGITGMRERAEALGGSLSAGPAQDGGFLVTARLPVASDRPR
ncbi:MAG TPA: sensor histidine kinase [Propionibacteriaceae bacterium]|jgi:signal transduction histidine kinase|nr:sensor histidine kinase [Propionibacteriaceae bacterium]